MARIIIEKDIEIPMRDGCVLKGDLYRPDSNEKLPVLLNRTPYDKKLPLISRLTLEREENPAASEELATVMESIDHMCDRMDFMPLREFPMFRSGAPYFFDWLEHPYYDDYWRKLCIEEYYDKIAVPTLNIGGWY